MHLEIGFFSFHFWFNGSTRKKKKKSWTKRHRGIECWKFSSMSFTADTMLWLTRLPCTTSHYFTPWSRPDGIENLDLQFILRPLLQIFDRVLSLQSVVNNLHQGGGLQIRTPELYPVPHRFWIAIILCVREGLPEKQTKKSTILLHRTYCRVFPCCTLRLSKLV